MYVPRLRTSEARLFKFEDINNQDNPAIKVNKSQREKFKQMQISKLLLDEIIKYKMIRLIKETKRKQSDKQQKEQIDGFLYLLILNHQF